jgi:ankyrin repeat protein
MSGDRDSTGWGHFFSRIDFVLLEACSSGDELAVKAALAAGANPDVTWMQARNSGKYGNSALHLSAERGFTGVADLLIAAGADVEARNSGGATPLHCAAALGRDEMCVRLLAAGADVESRDCDGETPLCHAAGGNQAATVRTLVAAGADLGARDSQEGTPLHAATVCGSASAGEALLALGADPNASNALGETPLHSLSIDKYGDKATAAVLIDAGADPESRDRKGRTPSEFADGRGRGDLAGFIRGYAASRIELPELETSARDPGDVDSGRSRKI